MGTDDAYMLIVFILALIGCVVFGVLVWKFMPI